LTGQTFAQFHAGHLIEPGLPDGQNQQADGDAQKNQQFVEKRGEIAMGKRVEKAPVPLHQTNLAGGGDDDDGKHAEQQQDEPVADG
jgi:hypothetical protein